MARIEIRRGAPWMPLPNRPQFSTEQRLQRGLREHNTLMDVPKILGLLRAELAQLNEAIAALERVLETSTGKRRGRPPRWLIDARRARANARTTRQT